VKFKENMINLVKQIISNLQVSPQFTALYGVASFQNLDDDIKSPFVFIYPINYKYNPVTNVRIYSLSMLFADLSNYDNTYDQHKTIIDSIEPSVIEFINLIGNTKNDYFTNIRLNSVEINEVINATDRNATGLYIDLTIECNKLAPIPPC
jgi:hypothetical protein